jgi:putative endonuclease
MEKQYWVYILANRKHGAIYIGVTSDLDGRIYDHKNNLGSKHAQRYNIKTLVYYEEFNDIDFAIEREKRLKKWKRAWKNELIESMNADWRDLSEDFT